MSDDQPERRVESASSSAEAPAEWETALDWMRRFSTPIAIGVGVIVVAGLIVRWLHHARGAERDAASGALYAAVDPNGFRLVVEDYPGTPSAAVALLGLGGSLFREGEYEPAREAYAEFVDTYPDHPMTVAAHLCVMLCLEAAGRLEQAREGLEDFLDRHNGHYLAPFARLSLGRCLEQLGRWEQARTVYEDLLVADDVNEAWVQEAELALETVRRELRRRSDAAAG